MKKENAKIGKTVEKYTVKKTERKTSEKLGDWNQKTNRQKMLYRSAKWMRIIKNKGENLLTEREKLEER